MKKMHLAVPALLVMTLLAAPACKPGILAARLDQEFQLSPGRQASIADEDLIVEFVRVSQDSRCPTGVECIQAGQAVCVVHLTQGGSLHEVMLTETGDSAEAEADYLGYHFIFNVLPHPEAGKDIRFENYLLVLNVTRIV